MDFVHISKHSYTKSNLTLHIIVPDDSPNGNNDYFNLANDFDSFYKGCEKGKYLANSDEELSRWGFSNMKELEEGFLRHYFEFNKLNAKNKLLEFYKKFNFKYSEHTNTFLKPIYIKGNFVSDKENEGAVLDVSIRKILRLLIKNPNSIAKELNFSTRHNSEIYSYVNKTFVNHCYEVVLDGGTKIQVIIINDEVITLSVDKNGDINSIYKLLNELYLITKQELIDNVKGSIDSILMNFSSEESNVINQYNYLALQIGMFDILKKSYLTEHINIEKNHFLNYSMDFSDSNDSDLIIKQVTHPMNLISLSIDKEKNELSRFTPIRKKYIMDYIIYGDINFRKKDNHEIEEMINYISTEDAELIRNGNEINWKNYWFDTELYGLKGLEFTKDYKEGGNVITFNYLTLNKDDYLYDKNSKELEVILIKFFRKSLEVNDLSSFVNDSIKLNDFKEKLFKICGLNLSSIRNYKEYIPSKNDYIFYTKIFEKAILSD